MEHNEIHNQLVKLIRETLKDMMGVRISMCIEALTHINLTPLEIQRVAVGVTDMIHEGEFPGVEELTCYTNIYEIMETLPLNAVIELMGEDSLHQSVTAILFKYRTEIQGALIGLLTDMDYPTDPLVKLVMEHLLPQK